MEANPLVQGKKSLKTSREPTAELTPQKKHCHRKSISGSPHLLGEAEMRHKSNQNQTPLAPRPEGTETCADPRDGHKLTA